MNIPGDDLSIDDKMAKRWQHRALQTMVLNEILN
jgi:hypothetical protein